QIWNHVALEKTIHPFIKPTRTCIRIPGHNDYGFELGEMKHELSTVAPGEPCLVSRKGVVPEHVSVIMSARRVTHPVEVHGLGVPDPVGRQKLTFLVTAVVQVEFSGFEAPGRTDGHVITTEVVSLWITVPASDGH